MFVAAWEAADDARSKKTLFENELLPLDVTGIPLFSAVKTDCLVISVLGRK